MKISELIKQLQEIEDKHGGDIDEADILIMLDDGSSIKYQFNDEIHCD